MDRGSASDVGKQERELNHVLLLNQQLIDPVQAPGQCA
jgi:hypothetical protein